MTDSTEAARKRAFQPLKQTVMHNPPVSYGDCARTALAMVLGLPAEGVPHFMDHNIYPEGTGNNATRAWLAERGLGYAQFPLFGQWGWDWVEAILRQQPGTPFIVTGRSPRGAWNHDVVYFNGKIHDPHPDGTGLAGPCIEENVPDAVEWYWINVVVPLGTGDPA